MLGIPMGITGIRLYIILVMIASSSNINTILNRSTSMTTLSLHTLRTRIEIAYKVLATLVEQSEAWFAHLMHINNLEWTFGL